MASGNVQVVATGRGFDGIVVREKDDEFSMPATVFDKRPVKDKDGKPTGEFYPPPSWFKLKETGKPQAKPASTDAADLT